MGTQINPTADTTLAEILETAEWAGLTQIEIFEYIG
jgi:hypothetical protein